MSYLNWMNLGVFLSALAACCPATAQATRPATHPATMPDRPPLEFIDTSFENASPLSYEFAPDGAVLINLLYDHERAAPNRAAGHFHFQLHAKAGVSLTLEFRNLDNIYNGKPGSVAKEIGAVVVSEDGRAWTSIPTQRLPGDRVRVTIPMPGPKMYVARAEPYRISDLDRLLAEIRPNPLVQITPIGKTVEGRELEIVRIGDERAPYRVFLRARAHPWEPGGNWVVQGLIHRLLKGDADAARLLGRYCVYILPMANKDGVARGRTRFNLNGKDLNRDWGQPADGQLAPENAALERWLEGMIAAGRKPHFALELHNDGAGHLHIHPSATLTEAVRSRYIERLGIFEKLLRQHTWFTEGSSHVVPSQPGTLPEGWLARFGIDGAVHEFNCYWAAGLNDYANGRNWEAYGAGLAEVLFDYFDAVKPQ